MCLHVGWGDSPRSEVEWNESKKKGNQIHGEGEFLLWYAYCGKYSCEGPITWTCKIQWSYIYKLNFVMFLMKCILLPSQPEGQHRAARGHWHLTWRLVSPPDSSIRSARWAFLRRDSIGLSHWLTCFPRRAPGIRLPHCASMLSWLWQAAWIRSAGLAAT